MAGVGFGEEILDQAGEAGGVFDLRPVAALAEHVQLRTDDPLGQGQRGGQGDHLILAAMDHQGFVGQGADLRLAAGQAIDPALARCGNICANDS